MYVINTKGFKPDDKISICNDYILPELLETFKFNKDEIIFDNDSLLYIIEKYTEKEEGVRNLKRCLETIISKINIYYLSQNGIDDENEKIPLTFEIKEFNLPLKISKEIVEELIKPREDNYKPPEHMYM
jgi:ATP-dependent Lon protease